MQQNRARRQLGEFLRSRRDALKPEDFGLPPGRRRRAPGLRREEAAQLCGISPTWFTWIEQGRTDSVSVASLAAIARGLRFSRAEREYLFELAARADPAPPSTTAMPDLAAVVNAVRAPAYVLDRHWAAAAWNKPAARLFAAWLGPRNGDAGRNLLRFVFLEPAARELIVGWEDRARRLVAEFRADTAGAREDRVRDALVHDLAAASPEFAAAWKAQRVLGRDGGRRAFRLRGRGVREYEQYTLRVAQQPELKLTVLVPAAET